MPSPHVSAMSTTPIRNTREFLAVVTARSLATIEQAGFVAGQRALLARTVLRYEPLIRQNPLGNPLALIYLIAEAWRRPVDEQVLDLACFANLYLLAADLIDDVQDEELARTPHAEVGPAIAVNSGLALLFLSLDFLRRSALDGAGLEARLSLFNRVSLRAVAGQHLDLLGERAARTPDEVLAMHEAKTSSLALIAECGALAAGVDGPTRARYRRVGEAMARLVQVVDDLRDLFGKPCSPDLVLGRPSYPVACLLDGADDAVAARWREVAAQADPGAVRALLYDSGAVRRVAGTLERLRREIHREIAATGCRAAAHRTWLDTVDLLVSSVYQPAPLPHSTALYRPEGAWHREVARLVEGFFCRVAAFDPPPPPRLRPWHLPPWVFDARTKVIAYPDLEEQLGEIAPFQAELLGGAPFDVVGQILRGQAPAVLAHELFHYWRDAAGHLSPEHWHEEYVANRLAIAYCREHEPAALAAGLELARDVLARFPPTGAMLEVVRGAETLGALGPGYHMTLPAMAIAQLAMVRELSDRVGPLESEIELWLRPWPQVGAAE